jgi:hypothetical protein
MSAISQQRTLIVGRKRSNEAFLFGKLPLRQTCFAQAVEDTIADFVNPERKDFRALLKRETGCKFQKRLYRAAGVVKGS